MKAPLLENVSRERVREEMDQLRMFGISWDPSGCL